MIKISALILLVSDLDTALTFFCQGLGCKEKWRTDQPGDIFHQLYELESQPMHLVKLALGAESIYLLHTDHPGVQPYPLDISSNDLAFQHLAIVVSDMDKAYATIRKHNIQAISHSPQTIPEWNEAAAGIRAFYFRSPSRYVLELIYFPSGKGNPRWQKKTADLFLGIDHTAITITDTQKSLHFYRDLLQFVTVGASLNYGDTQEKLSAVLGAKVQITGLHSPQKTGIGLEFLHYLNPTSTRSSLATFAHKHQQRMHLVVETDNLKELKQRLAKAHIPLLSEGMIRFEDGNHPSCITTDPNGHRLLLVEQQKENHALPYHPI